MWPNPADSQQNRLADIACGLISILTSIEHVPMVHFGL